MKKAIKERIQLDGIDLAYFMVKLGVLLVVFLILWNVTVGGTIYDIVNMTVAP